MKNATVEQSNSTVMEVYSTANVKKSTVDIENPTEGTDISTVTLFSTLMRLFTVIHKRT